MREYSITTEPLVFLSILDIQIKEEINEHGYLRIMGYIPDEAEEEYMSLLRGELWEKVELTGLGGERSLLFQGLITEFCIERINDQKKLTLVLRSGTWLMEEETHYRSWQNEEVTYEEIFQEVCRRHTNQGMIFSSPFQEKTGELVLQYEESDWSFLKRLASRKTGFLVAESRREGCKLYYDMPPGREVSFLQEGKYRIRKEVDKYMKKRRNGLLQLREDDCLIYELESRENYRIGDYLVVKGRRFYLYHIEGQYQRGEMCYRYQFMPREGLSQQRIDQDGYTGLCLKAQVIRVKEDKVQIRLLEEENRGQKITLWFDYATVYSTPDGTGWYCMPEIGDEVRLTIPGRKEKEAYITSAVHLDTDSTERKNPEEKVLKTRYKKEIRFTPDSIIITNNKGNRIELRDREGIQIVSSGTLLLEAAKEVTISSEEGSLLAAGASTVNLKQGGTSIQLDQGISFIGGELKVQ